MPKSNLDQIIEDGFKRIDIAIDKAVNKHLYQSQNEMRRLTHAAQYNNKKAFVNGVIAIVGTSKFYDNSMHYLLGES